VKKIVWAFSLLFGISMLSSVSRADCKTDAETLLGAITLGISCGTKEGAGSAEYADPAANPPEEQPTSAAPPIATGVSTYEMTPNWREKTVNFQCNVPSSVECTAEVADCKEQVGGWYDKALGSTCIHANNKILCTYEHLLALQKDLHQFVASSNSIAQLKQCIWKEGNIQISQDDMGAFAHTVCSSMVKTDQPTQACANAEAFCKDEMKSHLKFLLSYDCKFQDSYYSCSRKAHDMIRDHAWKHASDTHGQNIFGACNLPCALKLANGLAQADNPPVHFVYNPDLLSNSKQNGAEKPGSDEEGGENTSKGGATVMPATAPSVLGQASEISGSGCSLTPGQALSSPLPGWRILILAFAGLAIVRRVWWPIFPRKRS